MRSASWCGLAAVVLCAAAWAGDYPQWRGPARNGIVADSPALATTWPKAGPPRLWTTTTLPAGGDGGFGCPAVVGEKVFVYANVKYRVPITPRKLSAQGLRRLGFYEPGPPAEILQAVEKARVSQQRAKLKGKELNAWIKTWTNEHLKSDDDRKKFSRFVADRLNRGAKAMSLELLDKLATIKDKEFVDQAALDKWYADNGIDKDKDKDLIKTIARVIPTYIQKAWDKVYGFSAADGETSWEYTQEGRPSGWSASSTPCVADGRVYASGSAGNLYCLNAENGEEVWKVKAAPSGGLIHSSPLVADGMVVVLADDLVAMDATTGEVRWRQKRVRGRDNSPVLWKRPGTTFVISNTGKDVACVNLKTGDVAWTVPGGGQSSPTVAGDVLALVSARKEIGLAAYKMSADKAEKLWAKGDYRDGSTCPIVHDGYVYAVVGRKIVCVKVASGELAWEQKAGSQGWCSPALADGKIFAIVGREIWVIAPTPEKFNLLAKARLNPATYTSPAVSDGRMYIRLGKTLGCYDLRKGAAAAAAKP